MLAAVPVAVGVAKSIGQAIFGKSSAQKDADERFPTMDRTYTQALNGDMKAYRRLVCWSSEDQSQELLDEFAGGKADSCGSATGPSKAYAGNYVAMLKSQFGDWRTATKGPAPLGAAGGMPGLFGVGLGDSSTAGQGPMIGMLLAIGLGLFFAFKKG